MSPTFLNGQQWISFEKIGTKKIYFFNFKNDLKCKDLFVIFVKTGELDMPFEVSSKNSKIQLRVWYKQLTNNLLFKILGCPGSLQHAAQCKLWNYEKLSLICNLLEIYCKLACLLLLLHRCILNSHWLCKGREQLSNWLRLASATPEDHCWTGP